MRIPLRLKMRAKYDELLFNRCVILTLNWYFTHTHGAQSITLRGTEVTNYKTEIHIENTASNMMCNATTANEHEGENTRGRSANQHTGLNVFKGPLMCPRSNALLLRSVYVTSFGTGWEAITSSCGRYVRSTLRTINRLVVWFITNLTYRPVIPFHSG